MFVFIILLKNVDGWLVGLMMVGWSVPQNDMGACGANSSHSFGLVIFKFCICTVEVVKMYTTYLSFQSCHVHYGRLHFALCHFVLFHPITNLKFPQVQLQFPVSSTEKSQVSHMQCMYINKLILKHFI